MTYFKKLVVSLKRYIGRRFRRYTVVVNRRIFRPSSEPYVSGDTFRKYSNLTFDEVKSFKPEKVRHGQIVFVKTDLKEIFFKTIHPNIKNKYILLTHNSDENIVTEDTKYIDEKIIHWFAQNLTISENDKLSLLPIGFENRLYLNNGKVKNLKIIENNQNTKINKILSSFNVNTNFHARNELLKIVPKYKNIDNRLFDTPLDYLNNLKKYKFLVCPEGNGVDTHRIWEGLLARTVPIMLDGVFAQNLKSKGVPLVLLKDWSELANYNVEKIEENYKVFENINFDEFTKISFWMKKINSKKFLN